MLKNMFKGLLTIGEKELLYDLMLDCIVCGQIDEFISDYSSEIIKILDKLLCEKDKGYEYCRFQEYEILIIFLYLLQCNANDFYLEDTIRVKYKTLINYFMELKCEVM